jgi:hypothetical protein
MSTPMDTGRTISPQMMRIPTGVSVAGLTNPRARQERASVCPVFTSG